MIEFHEESNYSTYFYMGICHNELMNTNETQLNTEECSVKSREEFEAIKEVINSPSFNIKILEAEKILKSISDRTRIKLIALLMKGEMCVCDISEISGLSQSTVSNALITLENSGMVKSERRGKWHYYSLVDNYVLAAVIKLLEM